MSTILTPACFYPHKAGGVMGDTSAAIRDPIFFRWHKFIDDLFFLHKIKLPPYTPKELEFTKVRIDSVKVQVKSKVTHIDPNPLDLLLRSIPNPPKYNN